MTEIMLKFGGTFVMAGFLALMCELAWDVIMSKPNRYGAFVAFLFVAGFAAMGTAGILWVWQQ